MVAAYRASSLIEVVEGMSWVTEDASLTSWPEDSPAGLPTKPSPADLFHHQTEQDRQQHEHGEGHQNATHALTKRLGLRIH